MQPSWVFIYIFQTFALWLSSCVCVCMYVHVCVGVYVCVQECELRADERQIVVGLQAELIPQRSHCHSLKTVSYQLNLFAWCHFCTPLLWIL